MTDKKFTDEEIIKALECCISTTTEEACVGCPFNKQKLCDKDQGALERYALDLINLQKTEIERLKECPKCVYEYDGEITEYCVQGPCSNFKTVEQIKAEAYKEFAEKVKESFLNLQYNAKTDRKTVKVEELKEQMDWVLHTVTIETIDNLLKEMVGEEEANNNDSLLTNSKK